jgi:hypothetical protein
MTNAASTLQTAVNDILRSPAPCVSAFSRPVSVLKPLPSRPRSISVPSTPNLPAELPGSILLENQGFPRAVVEDSLPRRHPSQASRRNTLPLVEPIEDTEDISKLLSLFPEPRHSKSVPDLDHIHTAMRSDHNGNGFSPALASQTKPPRVRQKRSLSETSVRRPSQSHALDPLHSNNGKTTATSPSKTRNQATPTEQQISVTKTLQLPPQEVFQNNAERRVSHRSEVSTICFHCLVCLFVKQGAAHKETVSELLNFLFPPLQHITRRR